MKKRQKSKKNQLFIENILEPPTLRSTSFAKAYPEAARQWHYKRNCGFGPEDFSHGSTVRCWFKCPAGKDHIFQSPLHTVARAWKDGSWSQACPFCREIKTSITNSLASLYPELVPQWMTRKNGCNPEDIPLGSRLKAWWKCKKGHTWQAVVSNRTINDAGCPTCNLGTTTDLSDYPEVLRQFDHKENKGVDPHKLYSGRKYHWKCDIDPTHEGWTSGFYRTSKRSRCPSCTNQRGSKTNNLKLTHPEIAKEWDKEKNGPLKPTMVTANSSQRAFWKCKKGPDHEWSTKIHDHTRDQTRCPFCTFRKTSITNVITTLAPHLAEDWHPTKNGKATPDKERVHSRTKRWWLCSTCSYEWQAEPDRRYTRSAGCPHCYNPLKYPYKSRRLVKMKTSKEIC